MVGQVAEGGDGCDLHARQGTVEGPVGWEGGRKQERE